MSSNGPADNPKQQTRICTVSFDTSGRMPYPKFPCFVAPITSVICFYTTDACAIDLAVSDDETDWCSHFYKELCVQIFRCTAHRGTRSKMAIKIWDTVTNSLFNKCLHRFGLDYNVTFSRCQQCKEASAKIEHNLSNYSVCHNVSFRKSLQDFTWRCYEQFDSEECIILDIKLLDRSYIHCIIFHFIPFCSLDITSIHVEGAL